MTWFINTKFGFIESFQKVVKDSGETILKPRHCIDVRNALPFRTRQEAEAAYKKMGLDWWHCCLCTREEE